MKKSLIILIFFLVYNGIQATEFHFALLSDLHISKNTNAAEDLQNSVNQINRSDSIDFVLVTGDITEEGDRESLIVAKNILDQLKVNYYIIPGNHDTKWSESGATCFSHLFGSDRFKFEYQGYLFLGFNSGPLLRMADGHVVPQDISWLKQELSQTGKNQPVFLVTHYPVQSGDIDNWYDVTEAVRPYNIKAFLGGHYHSNRQFFYDGIPGIINRSNLRGKDSKGGYSIYRISPDSMLVYEQKIGEHPVKWASLSLKKDDFNEIEPVGNCPDFSVNEEYPNVKESWIKQTGVGIYSSPAVYKDLVFVGDDLGILTCYDIRSRIPKWTFSSGNRIVGTPAVSKGILVFGSADKNIYGIETGSGKLLWKLETSEPVLGSPAIDRGVVYIGSSDHKFRAIDLKTGKEAWTYDGVKGYVETHPLVISGKVIFGAWDNTLYALNQKEGTECWKWTGGLTRMHFSPAAVCPVFADGKVFIVDPERAMTAIDLQNGQTIWRTYQSKVRETIGISKDKERIFAKTMGDSIVCFQAKGNIPVQLWASNVGFGYEFAPSMLAEKDNAVFGSTKNGLFFALESKTGKILWKHKVGNSLINTVVPLSRHKLLFTAASGEIGILEWKE